MPHFNPKVLNTVIKALLIAMILVFAVFLVFQFLSLKSIVNTPESQTSSRGYNILIVGKSDNGTYLNQVAKGAIDASESYNAAVELYTGKSKAQEIPMQSLFDYASYLSADGVIAYISGNESLQVPVNRSGIPIPLITIGNYLPNLQQLSFIGVNFSELGKITANEIISLIGKSKKVILLVSAQGNNSSYSTMMNTLMNTLTNEHPEITVTNIVVHSETNFSKEDYLRQRLASEEGLELIVPLSEENTILAAQSVRDLNLSGKVKILGFGDSDDCRSYFEKNIVTELISVKTQEIGQKAMEELFEYINNGYANSYVSAEIEVLRREVAE
ncbi:MAG: substrate-binding domain-containing protein [Treponema sp.]|nr:substrate-binding domain-containing protein [Treponema sp.]